MIIPGVTVKCPNKQRRSTGKTWGGWRGSEAGRRRADRWDMADPRQGSALPQGESPARALERTALCTCKQRQGTQEWPWEGAQVNVKLKPWKLSPKSKYAVTQSVRRLARTWLSYEVTCWHVLSNSLASHGLSVAFLLESQLAQQPGSGSRGQSCPRGYLFHETYSPQSWLADVTMPPFPSSKMSWYAFLVSVWQTRGNI